MELLARDTNTSSNRLGSHRVFLLAAPFHFLQQLAVQPEERYTHSIDTAHQSGQRGAPGGLVEGVVEREGSKLGRFLGVSLCLSECDLRTVLDSRWDSLLVDCEISSGTDRVQWLISSKTGVFPTMFTKYLASLAIFGLFWGLIAGTAVEQYGVYGGSSISSTERINTELRCMNINPQQSVNLEQIMGLWYGSEIIVHTQDFPGTYEYDSCVIIHLADVTDQIRFGQANRGYGAQDYNRNQNNYGRTTTTTQSSYQDTDEYHRRSFQQSQQRYLRLVWSERDNNLEYTFNYTIAEPGRWSNIGDQRGSLVALNTYTQFTGTVQVVKAVNDHLVLTFCGNDLKSSIYTVVLSRNRMGLGSDELRSIRNLLSRRGLYTETIRKVCNGCGRLSGSLFALFALLLVVRLAWGRGQ
ncbi:uncharacterized protein LOC108040245 [Drosophila rhopaloa]|uniref:Uncharacterized protein LOC108040245 n=1 Tax=Drosophila rhopaloa TaxID=1041015 RepID=A0A6P4E981_DRORH|nr:uncharacterized protein LOC108040245 [Drosophila rhopaloa]